MTDWELNGIFKFSTFPTSLSNLFIISKLHFYSNDFSCTYQYTNPRTHTHKSIFIFPPKMEGEELENNIRFFTVTHYARVALNSRLPPPPPPNAALCALPLVVGLPFYEHLVTGRLLYARHTPTASAPMSLAARPENRIAMEAIGHKLFQLGDPEGKGFIVRRDMQVSIYIMLLLHIINSGLQTS